MVFGFHKTEQQRLRDESEHHPVRDMAAVGGTKAFLTHHDHKGGQSHPIRNDVAAGLVGAGMHHHHNKERREVAQEEAAAGQGGLHHHHHTGVPATGTGAAVGTGVAGTGAAATTTPSHMRNGATGNQYGLAPANASPSAQATHARSLQSKARLQRFLGSLVCSQSLKMKADRKMAAADSELKSAQHQSEANRLQQQAAGHMAAANTAPAGNAVAPMSVH